MLAKRHAKIFRGTPRNLARLARALAAGQLVAAPTETVYGLAGDALNPRACEKIFRAKGRPKNDPLIVHIASYAQLDQIAVCNVAAQRVAGAFWPGPLTLILPKKPVVPDLVTAGADSVAVRWPAHPLFQQLILRSMRPLAAPSANPFGYVSPTTAAHVAKGLGHRISYILDGGACRIGVESTILDLRDPQRPQILRPGAISAKELGRVLGRRVRSVRSLISQAQPVLAPGSLSKHYSPRTPLTLHRRIQLADARSTPDEAFVFFEKPTGKRLTGSRQKKTNTFWLSTAGDLTEAARRLFAILRQLDQGGWKRLQIERAPGKTALALAINDRLSRAAAKR